MSSRSAKRRVSRRRRRTARPSDTTAANDAKVNTALQYQRSGDYESAKQLYCEVLEADPENPDAWHLLGMTLYSAGESSSAIECLQKALVFVPGNPQVVSNLAVVHQALGNLQQAIELLATVVETVPEDANARNNLGVTLLECGDLENAQLHLEAALAIDSDCENASMNLANCWMRSGRARDAEATYRSLLVRTPGNANLMSNLAECLRRQCRWDEAIELLHQIDPAQRDELMPRLTLARTLLKSGAIDEGLVELESLAKEYPQNAKVRHYLGKTLLSKGDLSRAEEELQTALGLDSNDPHLYCTVGFLMIDCDRRDKAAECFETAVRLDPQLSEAHGCLLFLMCGDPTVDVETLFRAHVEWGELHGDVEQISIHQNSPDKTRRLRIGYSSADFRQHAVAKFFEPMLRLRKHADFEIFCYYESNVEDDITRQLRSMSDHWRTTLGYSDDQVAEMIQQDQIDIMMDLSGHTSGNRLLALARRPAPIQISWLGYPNTTGLKAIDYTLSCDVQNPVDEPSLHTEEILRIPGGSFCFAAPDHAPDVTDLPAVNAGHITFGSLHRPLKISQHTHLLWASAMRHVSDSRLLVFNTKFNPTLARELIGAMRALGIEEDRIEIRSEYSGQSYLETYSEIDIALDVTPWSGGTTTMEALWMGVPVVAFYGNNRPARGTAGIVHHLGKPDWIARTEEQYGELAGKLAGDLQELANLRSGLRELTNATIANQDRFVSELEKVYHTIWSQWCDKQQKSGT